MQCLKLYASFAATANNIATIPINRRGTIKCINWAARIDAIADNVFGDLELNLFPVAQTASNNSQGAFDGLAWQNNLVTSGMTLFGINVHHPVSCRVAVGDNLYLNAVLSGTQTVTLNAYIFLE